eukprot:CAMPEP_0202847694 /NCGR_PEP_ID=MMETSP1389-20130828/76107_1 /ASSEMBLY_ACC=CAM_ASM_000865 /TAXON_ID=302021 /ORGANISM="Rhodomonas sp., Strain CCMP768" /LENGTH=178 /DNA_ID=CAMNT_0049525441 /DNA_START=9 /DNA_END=545 /DNA_ORIENTATION=-
MRLPFQAEEAQHGQARRLAPGVGHLGGVGPPGVGQRVLGVQYLLPEKPYQGGLQLRGPPPPDMDDAIVHAITTELMDRQRGRQLPMAVPVTMPPPTVLSSPGQLRSDAEMYPTPLAAPRTKPSDHRREGGSSWARYSGPVDRSGWRAQQPAVYGVQDRTQDRVVGSRADATEYESGEC